MSAIRDRIKAAIEGRNDPVEIAGLTFYRPSPEKIVQVQDHLNWRQDNPGPELLMEYMGRIMTVCMREEDYDGIQYQDLGLYLYDHGGLTGEIGREVFKLAGLDLKGDNDPLESQED